MLHIVGGGGKNALLSQMTADAIGRPVVVGPFEATAMGNFDAGASNGDGQLQLRDIAHLRRIVADSFDLLRYEPSANANWDEAALRCGGFHS